MSIVIKLMTEDVELRDILRNEYHLRSRIGKNGGIFVDVHKYCGPCTIPEIIYSKEHIVLLRSKECGGSGFGQVVCGLEGQPLTPFCILEGRAYFSSKKPMATVTYYFNKKEPEIQIKKYYIRQEGNNVFIEEKIAYTGDPEPAYNYRAFDSAAAAAVLKGTTDGKEIRYANIPEDKKRPLSF